TPLLSLAAKLRLATEPSRRTQPDPQESFAAFLRRRLRAGVLPLGTAVALAPAALPLGDAMALGIYAGDPRELAVGYAFPSVHDLEREHGSVLRGLRRGRQRSGDAAAAGPRRLIAFRGGAAAFAGRLAAGLDLATGC